MEPTQKPSERDPYLWKQARERVGFKMHLRTYLIVNAGLWLIWALSSYMSGSAGYMFPWPIFPMLGWGIGLASHYFHTYRSGNQQSMIEEEYQKLLNQRG